MKFYIVDCFAEKKYQGNELLVVVADRMLSDDEQQQIAREINFSETAFILSDKQDNSGYDVRIWTPNVGEVPFAGHPTLGAAYVIHRILQRDNEGEIKLNLKVGQISVIVSDVGMMMKQNQPNFGSIVNKEEIAEIFGVDASEILDDYPIQLVSTGLESVLIPLKERKSLAKLAMDKKKFNEYINRHPECYCSHFFL